jgi:hypothetical protein
VVGSSDAGGKLKKTNLSVSPKSFWWSVSEREASQRMHVMHAKGFQCALFFRVGEITEIKPSVCCQRRLM